MNPHGLTLELHFNLNLGRFDLAPKLQTDSRRIALFGASGAGKSLTLEAIAGLVKPARGIVRVRSETFFDSQAGVNLAPQQRRVGYVPQQYHLFPHLSALQNIRYGLARNIEQGKRGQELLELVGLADHAEKLPRQLSGGQQQRVALARALATEPRLLLLDEPFAALDDIIRRDLRRSLAALLKTLNTPSVLVTHDLLEATMLADTLVIFEAGKVVQVGTPDDILLRPASRHIAELGGMHNFLTSTVIRHDGQGTWVRWFDYQLLAPRRDLPVGSPLTLGIRPEYVILARPKHHLDGSSRCLDAHITSELRQGLDKLLTLRVHGGGELELLVSERVYHNLELHPGGPVKFLLKQAYLWPLNA